MLGLRIITGVPLALAVIWFILTQSSDSLAIALILIAAIAGWEWAGLSFMKQTIYKLISALLLAMLVYLISTLPSQYNTVVSVLAVVWWTAIIIFLSRVKSIPALTSISYPGWLLSLPVLLPAMLAILVIHRDFGGEWLLFGMSLVWVADIGAYFAGRRFGKNKLAVVLSPGKTREGFFGAVVLTLIYSSLVCSFYFHLSMADTLKMLLITLVLNVYSVTGDLLESFLKRRSGVKDSGKILPGHGGVLDRIDSLTATTSLFLLGSIWIHSLTVSGL